MLRERRYATLLLFIAVTGCGAGGTNHGNANAPTEERVTFSELSSIDVSALTEVEQQTWLDLVNELLSPCGDPHSVGTCVVRGGPCSRCRTGARYVARLLAEGYDKAAIEDLYDNRFSPEQAARFSRSGSAARGNPSARVTIVEFSDFQCPFCSLVHPRLKQLVDDNRSVRLVFKHFPLENHTRAMPAAMAAVAAGYQSRFWEMHDLLFEHQDELEDEDFDKYAQQLGLDRERFARDRVSTATRKVVEADKAEGERLRVRGTPTFFINGRRYMEPLDSLEKHVEELLEE